MIKKVIHYCWFGKNKKSDLIERCIKSWEKYCPDYEIKEWNEENFDINKNRFVKEAYEEKKWAFVSDYVRLYALYNDGGVYVDTDLELTQNIDGFLKYDFFSGYESRKLVMTAIMGAQQKNNVVEKFLEYYKEKSFIKENGELDMTPNTQIITKILKCDYNLDMNEEKIWEDKKIAIFSESTFCKKVYLRENYAIHHFDGSWLEIKKIQKNLKMYTAQYSILNEIINLKYNENKMKKLIERIGDKTVCIYGFGSIGKILYERLLEKDIQIEEIYDNKIIKNRYGVIKKEIEADIVINCILYDSKKIIESIKVEDRKKFLRIDILLDLYVGEF